MVRKFLKNILGENFTENNAKLATVNFAIILFMFVLSGVMLFFLPDQISIIALIVNIGFIKQKRLSKMNSVVFAVLLVVMMVSYISQI